MYSSGFLSARLSPCTIPPRPPPGSMPRGSSGDEFFQDRQCLSPPIDYQALVVRGLFHSLVVGPGTEVRIPDKAFSRPLDEKTKDLNQAREECLHRTPGY
jgi:hypothetical protein